MTLNPALALVDACFTLVSLVCLILGYRAIRRNQRARHKRLMLLAFTASALFLGVFVARFVTFGFGTFHGTRVGRGIYQVVFLSHEPFALVNVPLAVAAVTLGLRRKHAEHREVARIALPVWVFVAVTGLVLYAMLYIGG